MGKHSAFPTDEYQDEQRIGQYPGMDLRDWFAGHVAAAISNAEWTTGTSYYTNDQIAQESYLLADALLRVRSQKGGRRAKH